MKARDSQESREPTSSSSFPLEREPTKQHLTLRLKRRVYTAGVILIMLSGLSSTVMAFLGTAS